tara:strand:- start:1288 stop:1512 length:225 start_codon:yes stop_codon:yes gene_type:complete
MSNNQIDLKAEFLLIFTKFEKINEKLDLIINKLDPNPEDLLSTSEINMMKSWRADVAKMNQLPHPAYDDDHEKS